MAMANAVGARSKNSCRWKQKSSKVVEAEMCNKVEARHLVLITRILDREKAHNAFSVEKEKRAVKGAMEAMKDTSGKSELGEAPTGPDDSDYRNSPYFLNGVGVISEKRLQKWRAIADQMTRELKTDADSGLLEPPWRTNPYENIEQSFQQLLDGLGYEEEAALVKYLKRRERRTFVATPPPPLRRKSSAAAARAGRRTRCDVFACLRSYSASGDLLPSCGAARQGEFSVQQWERAASQDYISAVTRQFSSGTEWPTSSYPSAVWATNSTSDARHLIKDSVSGDLALTHGLGDRRSSPTSTRHNINLPSACPSPLAMSPYVVSGPTERSIDARPVLPKVAGTNADTNNRNVGITGAREKIAIDGYRTYARNKSKKPRERMQKTASLESGRPNTAPNCEHRGDESETRHSQSATSWRGTNMGSMCGQAGTITESERGVTNSEHDTKPTACTQTSTTTTATTTRSATTPAIEPDPGVKAVAKATRSDVSNLVSETIEEVTTPSSSSSASSHRRKSPSLMSSSSSSSSSLSSSSTSSSPRHSTESKAAWRQNPRAYMSPSPRLHSGGSTPGSQSPHPSMESILRGPDTRRLPQWKRDLMAEAPPGLFSSREPVKVSVVMSKSQRQRELDQLVEENLSDVRTLVMQERARKMRARLNVFITMGTIQHAVAVLKKAASSE